MEEIKVADTARYVSFYAYDSADHISPADGITGFTVYYYLNNGSATAMTTPTVAEKDSTNMKGWYTLSVDEAGMVSAEGVTSINIEASGMDPVAIKVNIVGNTTKEVYDVVAPTSHCSTSGTVNTGSVDSGTHSDTCTDDLSYWKIVHSGGTIDVELEFGVGVNRVPTSVDLILLSAGGGGTLIIYAYNYLTSTWDKLNYPTYIIPDVGGESYKFSLLQDHVDVDGTVTIKVVSTGYQFSEALWFDLVNVWSINAGSIANGVKLGAQGQSDVNAEVVDTLTIDTIADSYSTDGSQPTITQAILAIHQMMQEKSISGTTLTVKKPDGSTSAMTFTLDSATAPTSVTRAT